MKTRYLGCACCLLLAAVLVGISVSTTARHGNAIHAGRAAQATVRAALGSAATFPETRVYHQKDGVWNVEGKVEAPTALGDYHVVLRYDPAAREYRPITVTAGEVTWVYPR